MFFSKKPTNHRAVLEPSGIVVEVPAGSTLLQAALDAGVDYPHSCRVGSCCTCMSYLKEGRVKELSDSAYVLSEEDLKNGAILACQSQLLSDIRLEVEI